MQHVIIRTVHGLEIVLCKLNWIFNICISICSAACISTYLYRTSDHRLEWAMFMGLLLRGIILLTVFVVIECILVSFISTENLPAVLSYEEAEKKGKFLGREGNILGIVFFVSTTVGRLIKAGKVQGLANDSWVASVYITLFLSQVFFFVCKSIDISYVYARITERLS